MNILEAIRRWDNGKSILNTRTGTTITQNDSFPKIGLQDIISEMWKVVEEKSPMDKAWDVCKSLSRFSSGGEEQYIKDFFEYVWGVAEKHFKSEK